MVLLMMKCWINLSMDWSQSLAVRFLKENPQTFEEACVLSERISQIANLVGGGGTRSKWREPPDYAPMELDSMGASLAPSLT